MIEVSTTTAQQVIEDFLALIEDDCKVIGHDLDYSGFRGDPDEMGHHLFKVQIGVDGPAVVLAYPIWDIDWSESYKEGWRFDLTEAGAVFK